VRSTELLLKQKCGETLCTPHNLLKMMWCAEMQMRNASEILRNAGGLGESISQNSLRVLPDFFGGILAGRALRKKIHNIEISAKPRYKVSLCLTHPPVRAQILLSKMTRKRNRKMLKSLYGKATS
jgi:hypothetical protein